MKKRSTITNAVALRDNIEENYKYKSIISNNVSPNLKLAEIKIFNENKQNKKLLPREDKIKIYIEIENQINMPMQCSFHLFCKPRKGIGVLTHIFTSHSPIFNEVGKKKLYVEIPPNFLITGKYQIDIGFGSRSGGKKPLIRHLKINNAKEFEIIETKKSKTIYDLENVRGVIHPDLRWSFKI